MKRVRLADVADLAGVSMKTVSTVVHNDAHFAPGLSRAAQFAVDERGYSPHLTPRRLAAGRTGVVCGEDKFAIDALQARRDAGIGVPVAVAVVHWGDTAMGCYTTPSLTSVAPSRCGLAEAAIELPGELISGNHGVGRNRVVPHSLAVRQGVPDAASHPGGGHAQEQYE